MNETEQSAPNALPLAAAAARLGISSDALRMRINRGKIRGFKRGGRLFAVLGEAPDQAERTAPAKTEQTTPERFEQARDRRPSRRHPDDGPDRGNSSSRPAAPDPSEPTLPLVVEFQKVELSRLLRDNSRLNQRLDQLIEELRHFREMQQREQVLRQQDQALRQRTQALIERLIAPPALAPSASAPPVPPVPVPPVSAPIDPPAAALDAPVSPDTGPSVSAVESESAAPANIPEDPAANAKSAGEPPDLHRENAHKERPPPPEPPLEPPNEPGPSREGPHRDASGLADMLKDIGASLLGLESAATDGPVTTVPEPPLVPGARRTPGDLAGPPSGPPSGPPGDDEAGLLEILGRMGTSAEERRTAARLMKRLFKGRAARRRSGPGDDVH